MMGNGKSSVGSSELHRRAEKAIQKEDAHQADPSPEDAEHLIHELRVHEVELEMQNEELRRIRRELERSRDKYSDLYDFAPVGYFTIGEDGLILEANLTGASLLEIERSSLIEKPFSSFVAVDDRAAFHLHRNRVFKTRELQDCELRMEGESGTQFHAQIESIAMQDDDGSFSRCRTIVCDITQRKRAEELQRFKILFDNAGDPIFIHDLEGRFLEFNQLACQSLGYSREEMMQMMIEDIDSPECPVPMAKRIEKLQQAGRGIFEIVRVRRDGTAIPFELSSRLIKYADRPAVLCIARDTTVRKRLDAEIQKVRNLESLGTLAGGIAHDFNNILTGILGNISLAKTYKDVDSSRERLKAAERACLRAKDLTRQLLTFARGGAPVKETASVAELLRDSASFPLSGSNVSCAFSISDDLWRVKVDKGQIAQVISNLVINAHQAMPDGGTIQIRAENVLLDAGYGVPLEDGKYVKISVKDHGVGIPAKHIQRIFDPYFTTKQRGSGLGLSSCYSIIKNHDGHITAESVMGEGSIFYIYLPASPDQELAKAGKSEDKPVMGEGKILIMDDEVSVRESSSKMLSNLGYEVTTAVDGAEAIELYKAARESRHPYDAVIVDLTIPGGMGGKEAMQRLKEIDPQIRAIVSSGYYNHPVMADFRKYGFRGLIAKPYDAGELSQVLHEVMAG